MGLDIWFAEDIRNALLAANEASAATARVCAAAGGYGGVEASRRLASTEPYPSLLRAYLEGYRAALATVALAFGIAPQAITLRPGSGQALQPFDCTQDRPLDIPGTIRGQEETGRARGPSRASLQPPEPGEEP